MIDARSLARYCTTASEVTARLLPLMGGVPLIKVRNTTGTVRGLPETPIMEAQKGSAGPV